MRIVDRRAFAGNHVDYLEMFPKGTTDGPLDDRATLGLSDRIVAPTFLCLIFSCQYRAHHATVAVASFSIIVAFASYQRAPAAV
ncbi:MAG: hypothetical protein GX933_10310 [Chloroflexi bacterium]|nr:hypothetical protein [Chloroflexota bacterium]